ncbi:MAG: hypothetical protein OEL83_06535 [Desulforhopalus sp.]|nr:hypothetical protein [Desulforhopalus sp.]
MKKEGYFILFLLFVTTAAGNCSAAGDVRIGGGANYWVALEDIEFGDKKYDKNGVAYLASYQYWQGLLGLELDLEFLPDRFGESALAPEAYILLGRAVYCGLGVGIMYSDEEFAEKPFFALRAGLNLEILPSLYADFYGNYRFNDSAELEGKDTNIDTDTVFLGMALRIAL